MTAAGRRDEGPLVSGAVSFILAKGKLVTVRQVRPRALEIGHGRASARVGSAQTGADVMLALIEGAAERLADVLAEATSDANALSIKVFDEGAEFEGLAREESMPLQPGPSPTLDPNRFRILKKAESSPIGREPAPPLAPLRPGK